MGDDGFNQDSDPLQTQEWLEALDGIVEFEDRDRAEFILAKLLGYAQSLGISTHNTVNTPYLNTCTIGEDNNLSDDEVKHVNQIAAANVWNTIAMVMKGHHISSELGGHIGSYASQAHIFEVALNFFLRGRDYAGGGDIVYFQGHSSEGLYSRAFLEGRLTKEHLDAFRQEITSSKGLSSYPHPWLMPDFWEYPSVSLGLGVLTSIYQAQFLKYLIDRGLMPDTGRKVWTFCGDGETDEVDTLGGLKVASRYKLDNLIIVVNCNLQRLDGLVNSNGKVIQELEGVFKGAGWNVIKVVWGSGWQALLKQDASGELAQRLDNMVDGEFQIMNASGVDYMKEHLFNTEALAALIADKSDEELSGLLTGGHDPRQLFAAYKQAVEHVGQPTVVLAHTIKGHGLGDSGHSKNVAHNTKDVSYEDRLAFCNNNHIALSESAIKDLDYAAFDKDSDVQHFLLKQRAALGGFVPRREVNDDSLTVPDLTAFKQILDGSGEREQSTTMVLSRILGVLLKDKGIKDRLVPIFSDETRTFGMEALFRQIGIYSPIGQLYKPEDHKQLMYYKEDKKGQLLQQGISEAGCMASWTAAGMSYSTNGITMIPFFIYYSMFGYQRVGDYVWAAADSRARGFIIGGTAGRTTLAGEGLQHQDGHNLLMFSVVPSCLSYDPTFGYEMAVLIHYGMKRMYQDKDDVFFYLTAMNENYVQPAMPKGVEDGIVKGMYLYRKSKKRVKKHIQLLGSGTILREVIKAADLLEQDYAIACDIWSVTSFNELRRDIEQVSRQQRLSPADHPSKNKSYVSQCFDGVSGPFIAATDYMKLYADQIRADVPGDYYVLGTDGFGRSDLRTALRHFFEVDANMIAYTGLKALFNQGDIDAATLSKAQKALDIDLNKADPVTQ